MRDRKNFDKALSFDQKGARTHSQLSRHRSTKWLTVALISLIKLYLPLTWDLSRSKDYDLS
jgi:hypothetical protein